MYSQIVWCIYLFFFIFALSQWVWVGLHKSVHVFIQACMAFSHPALHDGVQATRWRPHSVVRQLPTDHTKPK